MRLATLCVHAGMEPDPSTGAVVPPVYLTSTYQQDGIGVHKGFEYSRTQNPTRQRLETAIAALEGAKHALAFSSGLAAIDAVMHLLKSGDTIVSLNDVYGGTYRLFSKVASGYGLKAEYLPVIAMNDATPEVLAGARVVWIESPTNPMLRVVDIRRIAQVAASSGAILVVDNTFASPILQQPLPLGATIVVHSGTKYLAGHSDVVIGAVAVNDDGIAGRLRFFQNACGAVPGPMDCWLTHRGIRTLPLRMAAHCAGATAVFHALSALKGVRVFYPGTASAREDAIAAAQMEARGGLVTVEFDGGRRVAEAFMKSLRLFAFAESLGGVESLACHPATMTHASIPEEMRREIGITEGLVRLSVGVEDPADLVEDVMRAAEKTLSIRRSDRSTAARKTSTRRCARPRSEGRS